MKKKEEPIYSDFDTTMEKIKERNKLYENATPEYKVLQGVLNHLSDAFYAIKYKTRSREDILLELAQAKGEVTVLAIKELYKNKVKE